jgi:hypothetical protein
MTFLGTIFATRAFPMAHFEPLPMEFEVRREEDGRHLPTAGELAQPVERLPGINGACDTGPAEELRKALAEIRRSLA